MAEADRAAYADALPRRDGYLVVQVKRIARYPGAGNRGEDVTVLTVDCPLCGWEHSHGGGPDGTNRGHRASDCGGRAVVPDRGYILADAADGPGEAS
jgi:hypothetical protein